MSSDQLMARMFLMFDISITEIGQITSPVLRKVIRKIGVINCPDRHRARKQHWPRWKPESCD